MTTTARGWFYHQASEVNTEDGVVSFGAKLDRWIIRHEFINDMGLRQTNFHGEAYSEESAKLIVDSLVLADEMVATFQRWIDEKDGDNALAATSEQAMTLIRPRLRKDVPNAGGT